MEYKRHSEERLAFTLIEMSVVLVVIGLIGGGILVGQDLINSAAIRTQISQVEKYNTAVRTFQNKYGYLPGDIPDPYATSFGFISRGAEPGQGDGNGILQGMCWVSLPLIYMNGFEECWSSAGNPNSELTMMWLDLNTANLINNFKTNDTYPFPEARIGQSVWLYAYSSNGINYFAISTITNLGAAIASTLNPGLTVQQAYNIDKKMDDGLPQSGNVTACYVNNNVGGGYSGEWAAGGNNAGASPDYWEEYCVPTTAATPYQTYNCYDNNNVTGTETYSLLQNANVQNCALSFKFQ